VLVDCSKYPNHLPCMPSMSRRLGKPKHMLLAPLALGSPSCKEGKKPSNPGVAT
jgi:hypothetical protein